MGAKPNPELIQLYNGQLLKQWPHGYPLQTGWRHPRPEHDLHLVETAAGRMDAGGQFGPFGPCNLLQTGSATRLARGCLVLPFPAELIASCKMA